MKGSCLREALRQKKLELSFCCSFWRGPLAPAESQTLHSAEKAAVTVDWNKVIRVSNTNATLQVVVTPLMARNSPIHDKVFGSLKDLRCDLRPLCALASLSQDGGGGA